MWSLECEKLAQLVGLLLLWLLKFIPLFHKHFIWGFQDCIFHHTAIWPLASKTAASLVYRKQATGGLQLPPNWDSLWGQENQACTPERAHKLLGDSQRVWGLEGWRASLALITLLLHQANAFFSPDRGLSPTWPSNNTMPLRRMFRCDEVLLSVSSGAEEAGLGQLVCCWIVSEAVLPPLPNTHCSNLICRIHLVDCSKGMPGIYYWEAN